MTATTKFSKCDFGLQLLFALWLVVGWSGSLSADEYLIQAGDVVRISVWKEPDLQQELIVRPDGNISFPLAGEIIAADRTAKHVEQDVVAKIEAFIPEPVVTVQVVEARGNTVYVVGKVNRPGAFVMSTPIDVTQALALAGGTATFADEDKISILRREGGSQSAIPFDFSDVQYGRELTQNILLRPGDVVVVP